jgi:hypothetical protein
MDAKGRMQNLDSLLPESEKRTNQIYLASEDLLFRNGASPSSTGSIAFVNDNAQLESHIARFRKTAKANLPETGRRFFDNLFHSSTLNLVFLKIDLTKWALRDRLNSAEVDLSKYFIIREDSIPADNIAEFLELYSSTSPIEQPQIVFVPKDTNSSMFALLRYANPQIAIRSLDDGRVLQIERGAPQTLDEFAELFERRCFDAAAAVSSEQLESWMESRSSIARAAADLMRIRARILTLDRHEVEPELDKFLSALDKLTADALSEAAEPFLLLRTTALLQKTFCSEDPAFLEEALAISSTLGHDLGIACCLRYAHMLDVHPALEDHMLKRAEAIFRKHRWPELELYCINNRLVSYFEIDRPIGLEFDSVLSRVSKEVPGLWRRGDIEYNAGIAHLLAGRLQPAKDAFARPILQSARPLIIASAKLATMVCERMSGQRISRSAITQFLRFVSENVDKRNRWHITNFYLNMLALISDESQKFDFFAKRVSSRIDLKADLDVRDYLDVNSKLAVRLGLKSGESRQELPGRFGEFFNKTGIALPHYFIWS